MRVAPFELEVPPLLLRPWRRRDLPDVTRAFADPEIARWQSGGWTLGRDAVRAWLAQRVSWTDPTRVALAVCADGKLLGSVALHHVNTTQRDAEVGYWVLPEARGRGAATGAVAALTHWAFTELRLERIEIRHAVANAASCRVATRCGYRHEGTMRHSHRYGDGDRHDEHIHGRLPGDEPT